MDASTIWRRKDNLIHWSEIPFERAHTNTHLAARRCVIAQTEEGDERQDQRCGINKEVVSNLGSNRRVKKKRRLQVEKVLQEKKRLAVFCRCLIVPIPSLDIWIASDY